MIAEDRELAYAFAADSMLVYHKHPYLFCPSDVDLFAKKIFDVCQSMRVGIVDARQCKVN